MTNVLESFRRVVAENLRFALIALRAHKLRAFLTMVGIVIGVWTVIGMVALVTGFDRSQTEAFSSFGTTLVQFQKFEPRFGAGPALGGGAEAARTSRSRTPRRSGASARRSSPSRPSATMWSASQVKGERQRGELAAGRRREPELRDLQQLDDPGRAERHRDRRPPRDGRRASSDRTSSEALFKGKDPLGADHLA